MQGGKHVPPLPPPTKQGLEGIAERERGTQRDTQPCQSHHAARNLGSLEFRLV